METIADKINNHLKSGGAIQVSTYLKSTIYRQKHAGMFKMSGKNLMVQRGRKFDQLSIGERILVSIRFSKLQ